MYRTAALLGLTAFVLQGCGAAPRTAAVLPTFVSPAQPAAPEMNEAYPSAQASESNSSRTASGFTVDLDRAWRDGKQVYADTCFTMPDASDWTIWSARLEYGGQVISEFGSSLLSRQESANGQPAKRCDQLGFYVPPDADLSSAELIVESLGAYPSGDEYCSLYMPKIQQALIQRGVAITLNCADLNGRQTMQIASRPADMSQEAAEQIVFSDEFYTVSGPWSFPVTFKP